MTSKLRQQVQNLKSQRTDALPPAKRIEILTPVLERKQKQLFKKRQEVEDANKKVMELQLEASDLETECLTLTQRIQQAQQHVSLGSTSASVQSVQEYQQNVNQAIQSLQMQLDCGLLCRGRRGRSRLHLRNYVVADQLPACLSIFHCS